MDPDRATKRTALLVQLADVDATLQSLQHEQDAFRTQRNEIATELNDLLSQHVAATLAREEQVIVQVAQEENMNLATFARLVEEEIQAERDHEMASKLDTEVEPGQTTVGGCQAQDHGTPAGLLTAGAPAVLNTDGVVAAVPRAAHAEVGLTAQKTSKRPASEELEENRMVASKDTALNMNKRARIEDLPGYSPSVTAVPSRSMSEILQVRSTVSEAPAAPDIAASKARLTVRSVPTASHEDPAPAVASTKARSTAFSSAPVSYLAPRSLPVTSTMSSKASLSLLNAAMVTVSATRSPTATFSMQETPAPPSPTNLFSTTQSKATQPVATITPFSFFSHRSVSSIHDPMSTSSITQPSNVVPAGSRSTVVHKNLLRSASETNRSVDTLGGGSRTTMGANLFGRAAATTSSTVSKHLDNSSTTMNTDIRDGSASFGAAITRKHDSSTPTKTSSIFDTPTITSEVVSLPEAPPQQQCVSCLDRHNTCDMLSLSCKCLKDTDSHAYCRNCLCQMFDLAMKDSVHFPPRCCSTDIPLLECKSLLPNELYRNFASRQEELSTPDPMYCSNTLCSAWIRPSRSISRVVVCDKCKQLTCTSCRQQFHSGSCPVDLNAKRLIRSARQKRWQTCPNCRQIVELHQGCYHITCRCKHEFCYLCAAKWKTCKCETADEDQIIAGQNSAQSARAPVPKQAPNGIFRPTPTSTSTSSTSASELASLCKTDGHDFEKFHRRLGWDTRCPHCKLICKNVSLCHDCGFRICNRCIQHGVK